MSKISFKAFCIEFYASHAGVTGAESYRRFYSTKTAVALTDRFSLRTVSLVVDANGNGIPDAWETLYGLSGESALADADPDGDGVCNLDEYNAGTNPTVADDWSLSTAVNSDAFVKDTRVVYTGGRPSFDEGFAVYRVS